MTSLVFDLDGTLSDPAEGLLAAINHALAVCGQPQHDPVSLRRFIGPSLDRIFGELLDTDDPRYLQQAIDAYRDVYYRDGYRQNVLYPGIPELLENLAGQGFKLFVATAKRQDIAQRVVDHFGLGALFSGVLGCGLKRQKHELLRDILAQRATSPMVMIGDRANDIEAARAVGAGSVGVLWGYGDAEELGSAGADALVASPAELSEWLERGRAGQAATPSAG